MTRAMPEAERLSIQARIALAGRIWAAYLRTRREVPREPLPGLARRLGESRGATPIGITPRRLGHIVGRVLRVGPWRPRCLFLALVLYRLLREEGQPVELVIGMPSRPVDEDAHAWVELEGVDLGPPPGRVGHEPLARFS